MMKQRLNHCNILANRSLFIREIWLFWGIFARVHQWENWISGSYKHTFRYLIHTITVSDDCCYGVRGCVCRI